MSGSAVKGLIILIASTTGFHFALGLVRNKNFPECRLERSALNIETPKTQFRSASPIVLQNYLSNPRETVVSNEGNLVEVRAQYSEDVPTLTGGGLNGSFSLAHYQLLWSKTVYGGTEHTIDDHKYPLEVHLIHQRDSVEGKEDHGKDVTGFAALVVLYEFGAFDNPGLQPVINALKDVNKAGDKTRLGRTFPVRTLLPLNIKDFFFYRSFSTDEGCGEAVNWIILNSTHSVSLKQLAALRKLRFHGNRGASPHGSSSTQQNDKERTVFRSFAVDLNFTDPIKVALQSLESSVTDSSCPADSYLCRGIIGLGGLAVAILAIIYSFFVSNFVLFLP